MRKTKALAPEVIPIDLLVVDLMFTILVLQGRKRNRRQVICDIYRYHGQLPDSITDKEIWETISRMRERLRSMKHDEKFWDTVNQWVFEELITDGVRKRDANVYAKRVHHEILTNEELYATQPTMLKLIRRLRRRGVRVVVGSNQVSSYAATLIKTKRFRLQNAFDAVYTSEDLDERKPHPEFWRRILEKEATATGTEIGVMNVAHLGNSANSDVGAAELGIRVLLYDRYHELDGLTQGRLEQLSIPEQDATQLIEHMNNKLISVHNGVPGLRSWFMSHLRT
jgi:FMN phosphatase YigB (HAD superfamily)